MMQKSKSAHPLVRQLYLCGQIAEHKSEKSQEHGIDENEIFAVLSAEEQAALAELLGKLQTQWAKDHAAHHKKAD